jgi:peptidoglycan hydrolase CwlO-like protein
MDEQPQTKRYNHLEDEIKATDKKVSAIDAHLSSLTKNVEHLGNDLRDFIRVVSARLNDVNKTNWGPILTALAMSGATVAFYATLLSSTLHTRIDESVGWLKERQDLIRYYENERIVSLQNQVNEFQRKHYDSVSKDKDELELKLFSRPE